MKRRGWCGSAATRRPGAIVALAFACAAGPIGCVSNYDEFDRHRRAYQDCLDEHPEDPSQCDELRDRADQAYEAYERGAKRQWGCDRDPDRCNEPRPGQP